MTPDVNIVEIDLPTTISSYAVSNPDTTFTIVLNARLTHERRLEAYQHELEHIQKNDFSKDNVQAIECAAHGLTVPDNAEQIPADKYLERIKACRRRRRKAEKLLREYEQDLQFLEMMGLDTFARGERFKLYGNDL